MKISIIIAMCYIFMASTSIVNVVNVFIFDYNTQVNRTVRSINDKFRIYFKTQIANSTPNLFHFLFNRIICDFSPIPLVMICNVIMIICLRKDKIIKSTVDANQKQQRKYQERQLTKLFLTISLLFLILCGPIEMHSFLLISGISHMGRSKMDIILQEVLTTLSLVNSAVNFIVYTLMSTKYREEFVKILCCFKQRDRVIDNSGKIQSNSKTKVTQ